MSGLGVFIVMAFVFLTLAIVTSACADYSKILPGPEGFASASGLVPAKVELDTKGEPKGYTQTADLPFAPVSGLSQTSPKPFENPALAKASLEVLRELKSDMDSFAGFEYPNLVEISDPAVKLPITRFKGDYERVKDEYKTLVRNEGLQSQLTMDDIDGIIANLRFLQRMYRTYANNQMVPEQKEQKEGFESSDPIITVDELKTLKQKLTVEIARLTASGTSDPVLTARVSVLTKMNERVTDLVNKINDGTMTASEIPIKKSDYNNFLPVLTNSTSGIGRLFSNSSDGTLASLFNNYDAGDISGSEIAAALFEKYADDLIKGTSFQLTYSYTSPNQVDLEQARATQVDGVRAILASGGGGADNGNYSGGGEVSGIDTNHPGTTSGARGTFDATIRNMDLDYLTQVANRGTGQPQQGRVEGMQSKPGKFDWKERANAICENVSRAGLNPRDFGCMNAGAAVSSDFSWRGQAKMVCNRLGTHFDSGVPEQMGCPPVSWKGWRI
jgi:hypothetical protein